MARFDMELPTELERTFEELADDTQEMLEEMTQEGAKTVLANVSANVPASFHGSEIMKCLKMTDPYKTPSDDGVNTKIAFYGYFTNKKGKDVPAPLVCNIFEHGRSTSKFPKHPFMRRSFKRGEIEAAMKRVEEKYIKGD